MGVNKVQFRKSKYISTSKGQLGIGRYMLDTVATPVNACINRYSLETDGTPANVGSSR